MTGFSADNTAYEPPMIKAAFLRWVQRQVWRHELKNGRAIMQALPRDRDGLSAPLPSLRRLGYLSPMKTSDVDILIVPGWQDSGPDHWQSRWERSLKTARRVIQDDWDNPDAEAWGDKIAKFAAGATQPVVLVAHSLGVPAVVYAADKLIGKGVIGAFLVAPADVEFAGFWPDTGGERWPPTKGDGGYGHMPKSRLPFPAELVVGSNDLYCSFARAEVFASQWGAKLTDAGETGHINVASGHGPWPEGLLQFGKFLKGLG
jgi:uncharacterized protein